MSLVVSNQPLLYRLKCFFKYNKKKMLFASLFSLILVISLCTFSYFTACDPSAGTDLKEVGLIDAALSMVRGIYGLDKSAAGTLSYDTAHSLYQSVADGANIDLTSGNANIAGHALGSALGVAMTSIHDWLVPIAITVATILWFPSLASTLINGQAYAEMIIKRLTALGISIFLIYNSMAICVNVVNAGSQVTSQVVDVINASGTQTTVDNINTYNEIRTELLTYKDGDRDSDYVEPTAEESEGLLGGMVSVLQDIGMFFYRIIHKNTWKLGRWVKYNVGNPLGVILQLALPSMMLRIAIMLASVFTIMRAVEAVVLIMLSPIPFAIIGNEPLGSGAGARFIKNLFALSLQGAVMVLTAYACQSIFQGLLNECHELSILYKNVFPMIAVSIAELGLLSKSLPISQKVFGLQ